ncbi:MAG TPA: class I SAM-dependent methyltransferase [Bacteroidia bacterium]|jgi:hypothetical protein|nr:class I SAM-dependent methyltransferase [Bacteroidia bacterium]
MSDIIKKQIELYRSNFLSNSDSPEGVFWNNTTTQFERFNQLITPLLYYRPSGFSICDIGSGVCDLHQFLLDKKIDHAYTGIEIIEEMITKARDKFKDIDVKKTDILSDGIKKKYDFVVSSGTFNLRGKISEDEWKVYIFKMLKQMFEMAEIGISFNVLTSYSTFRAPELFYSSPEEMTHFIQTELSRFYQLNSAYPLYEITYTVIKEKHISEKFSHEHFTKYFSKK